ncbi:MAG: protein phosphatase 2C domain-containing protein [Deltaproteobacteria bacterium]|jgi:serine/threonine protein phosphatase PrpC|nr:protein phosphatase 2C domain-containing protein [Deltaproteobacteria bacterium]
MSASEALSSDLPTSNELSPKPVPDEEPSMAASEALSSDLPTSNELSPEPVPDEAPSSDKKAASLETTYSDAKAALEVQGNYLPTNADEIIDLPLNSVVSPKQKSTQLSSVASASSTKNDSSPPDQEILASKYTQEPSNHQKRIITTQVQQPTPSNKPNKDVSYQSLNNNHNSSVIKLDQQKDATIYNGNNLHNSSDEFKAIVDNQEPPKNKDDNFWSATINGIPLQSGEEKNQLQPGPPSQTESAPPSEEIKSGGPVEQSGLNKDLASKQPQLPEDSPQVILKFELNANIKPPINDQLIKYFNQFIDELPPITGAYNKILDYEININSAFKILNCESNDFLKQILGIKVEFSGNTVTLSNTPKKGYDGVLYFLIFVTNFTNGGGSVYHKEIYIAPDPKTLWRDLEVADYDGYYSPDKTSDAEYIPNNKIVVAASCRGRSHAHEGKPRDDSFAFNVDPATGWNIVAVADGAGSAKYSRAGSKIACETVIKELTTILSEKGFDSFIDNNTKLFTDWRDEFYNNGLSSFNDINNHFRNQLQIDKIFYTVVYQAFTNILDESKTKKASLRDYHTTLLFMGFKRFSFGYFFGSFWIGDGAMAIYNPNKTGKVLVLGSPDSGEYAGQTRFLTMAEEIKPELIQKRTCFGFFDDFESIILVTDGITDPFFPSDANVISPDKWRQFWTKTLKEGDEENPGCPKVFDSNTTLEEKGKDLLNWLNFWSKGNHDDRTILIVK